MKLELTKKLTWSMMANLLRRELGMKLLQRTRKNLRLKRGQ